MTATCKSCGAPILWIHTDGGRREPLDATPEKRFVIDPPVPAPGIKISGHMRNTYVSHFANCPNAAEHRKPK